MKFTFYTFFLVNLVLNSDLYFKNIQLVIILAVCFCKIFNGGLVLTVKKVRKTNLLKTRNFPLDIFRSSGVFYDNQLTKLIWRLEFYGSSSWKFQMPMKTQKKTRVCSAFIQQSPKNRKILLIFSFVHMYSTNYIQIKLIT